MKLSFKIFSSLALSSLLLLSPLHTDAKAIVNPDGSQPLIHWAILRSSDGEMKNMQNMAAKHVAPYSAKEDGTYIIYGGIDKNNPNIQRLLEIYKDEDAYQIHRSSEGFKQYQIARATILEELRIMEVNPVVMETQEQGTGNYIITTKIEVRPEALADFKKDLTELVKTSIQKNPDILAIMATSEKENPNILHILEVYKDATTHADFINSPEYINYERLTRYMINSKIHIEYLPTDITLSNKPQ